MLIQQGHPIAFVSKGLGPRTRGLSTYEKEYMAILLAVEQWRAYLQHVEFLILTDHCSLAHLEDQRLHTPWQQKVFTKLLGLQFKIKYKEGSENRVADALSRMPHPDAELLVVTCQQPLWLQDVVATYQDSQEAQELLTRLAIKNNIDDHFSLQAGLIRYKKRLWLPSSSPLTVTILKAFHDSPLGGHSGVPITLRRLKQLFYWKRMSAQVHKFVHECLICQRAKPDRAKYPGLLAPLPVPSQYWQMLTMDFCGRASSFWPLQLCFGGCRQTVQVCTFYWSPSPIHCVNSEICIHGQCV